MGVSVPLCLLVVVAVCCGSSHNTTNYFELLSLADADCSDPTVLARVKIPFGCLNNHDFSAADCNTLAKCLSNGTVWYHDLAICTGAPSMALSVSNSITQGGDSDELRVALYPISKTCFGIPVPLHYKEDECAFSKFALSPKCGHAGAKVEWESDFGVKKRKRIKITN